MARIRTIKPSFWTDSKTGSLSAYAKVLFIGLMNHVDDYGVIRFDVAEFAALIFPYDVPSDARRNITAALLDEIYPRGLAIHFSADDTEEDRRLTYLWIKNFSRHQKVDKPGEPLIPDWNKDDTPEKYAKRKGIDYEELCEIRRTVASPRESSPLEVEVEVERELKNKRETREKPCDADASPPPLFGPQQLMELWNERAANVLPRCSTLSDLRTIKAKARIREHPNVAFWERIIDKLNSSAFCTGDNDRGWLANFDFILQKQSLLKLGEGHYDNRKATAGGHKPLTDAKPVPRLGD